MGFTEIIVGWVVGVGIGTYEVIGVEIHRGVTIEYGDCYHPFLSMDIGWNGQGGQEEGQGDNDREEVHIARGTGGRSGRGR